MNKASGSSSHGVLALLVIVLAAKLATAQVNTDLRAYQPQPVLPPRDASYLLPDGSIYIVGSDAMEVVLTRFNELFTNTHHGIKFTMLLKGSSTALAGLTAGVSVFAPMDRAAWPLELRPFRQLFGYEPTDIHIGRVGFVSPGRANPPAIYVNAKNPIAGLTLEQMARIFTTGGGRRDLTHWRQLGLTGEWANRVIHVYGPRDDGGFATAMRHEQMSGFPFTRNYEPLSKDADIIKAVADDLYGIALVGFFDSRSLPRAVKLVPLGEKEGAYSIASYQDVYEGKYPFTPYLRLYVNRAPGQPMDPFVKEYVRLVLSREGQAVIAAQESENGYVPLNAREIAAEVRKLE